MDPQHFTSSAFGTVKRQPGKQWAFHYFSPAPIPRTLELAPQTVELLADAEAALGQLQGLGQLITDPELLIGPYLRREAISSTRIEGTQASLSDVLQAEVSAEPARSEDVREVERYLQATRHAWQAITTLPITQRLIMEVHQLLLTGVRGEDRRPGELRRSPVWIGAAHDNPDSAIFVPPLPEEVPAALSDWEDFVNNRGSMPTLIRCALMHYQFETIHPFLDGNGRIGRLLINLLLNEEGRLTRPLLYISGFFESHRAEYYQRLQQVREHAMIQEWLQFFLAGVRAQASDANKRAISLIAIRERYLAEAASTRGRLAALADALFRNPYVTVASVAQTADLSLQGARNLIRLAVEKGWLADTAIRSKGGRVYWVAEEIFSVIDAPADYARRY